MHALLSSSPRAPRRAPHANGRAAGRLGAHRWELEPEAAGLRTLRVKLHQQYESPAAVMQFVRHVWQPDFDAMATPFSVGATCGRGRSGFSAAAPQGGAFWGGVCSVRVLLVTFTWSVHTNERIISFYFNRLVLYFCYGTNTGRNSGASHAAYA